jgi:hypothetical protein
MEDYKTRKDRLDKTGRTFVKMILPTKTYEAFRKTCEDKGLTYTQGFIMALTKWSK